MGCQPTASRNACNPALGEALRPGAQATRVPTDQFAFTALAAFDGIDDARTGP